MQEISYLPGRGTVIVAGDTILLLDAPVDADVSRTIWQGVAPGMSHERIRAVLESYGPARLPDLGVVSLTDNGVALLLRGAARAAVATDASATDYTDDGSRPAHAPPTHDRRVWTEYLVASVSRLRLWLREPDPAVRALPLVGGVVAADSVYAALTGEARRRVVSTAEPPPAAAIAAPEPAPRPVDAPLAAPPPPLEGIFVDREPPSVVRAPASPGSLAELWVNPGPPAPTPTPPVPTPAVPAWPTPAQPGPAAPPRPPPAALPPPEQPGVGPRPGVWAARCPHGHLNAPDAPVCRTCGTQIVDRDLSFVARPPLGRLDFGPLGSVPLDGDLLIGREPGEQPTTAPRPVVIAHPALSDRHVEVQVRGWTVIVVDLDSQLGTAVVLPGRAAKPLRARSPEPIVEGTVVWLAQQVYFTYLAT